MTTEPQSTTQPKLEPCPFCGKKAKGFWAGPYLHVSGPPDGLHFYSIVCNSCCSTAASESKDRAIQKWNSRAPAPTVAPVVDEQWVRLLANAISTAVPTLMPERDSETHYIVSSEAFAGLVQVHRAIAKQLWGASPVQTSTPATPRSEAGSVAITKGLREQVIDEWHRACHVNASIKRRDTFDFERLASVLCAVIDKTREAGSVVGIVDDDLRTPLDEIEAALISIAEGTSPQEAARQAFDVINRERLRLNTATASTVAPVEQSEAWRDPNGHAWELHANVECVECPHCLFTFAATHRDGETEDESR